MTTELQRVRSFLGLQALPEVPGVSDEVAFRQAEEEAVTGTEPCPDNTILEPPDGGRASSSGVSSLWDSKNW